MKKILLALSVSVMSICAMAQTTEKTTTTTTTTTHKYYYYPDANVYYDQSKKDYWYNSGSDWTEVQALPSTVVIEKSAPRYMITYHGDDPWKNNALDLKKYKSKKGTVKAKGQ